MTALNNNSLKRVLSGWDVFFIAVGQIIGAGVIALTGIAIGMTGPSVIFAYLLSAALVLIVTILIMMAGSVLPAVGAYYAWCSRLSGGWMGTIVLGMILLASVSLSLYGSSFGLYLNPLFPILSVNQWGVLVILLLFLANLFGLHLAAKVQVGLVAVLVSALAIYAGFAIPKVDQALLTPWLPQGVVGFVTAVFLLKFATGGAYMIVGLSGEMKNPRRVIPIVMTTATIAVAAIYSFVALASVAVLPWQEMVNQPLTVAGQQFLPGWAMTYFLVGGAGLAICTTLNSQFIQLPRTFIVASWDRLIPARLGRLNRYGAPHYILAIMMVIGVVPLIVGLDIGDIARAATISASLPSIFVYWSLTRIHTRYPEQYAKSMFNMKPVWIWSLFLFSELSTFVGIYFLSRDLSSTVIWSLVVWAIVAVAYYPIRRYFLAKQGFDLDAATTDDSLFHHD
tara:strand:- start:471 stop:1826 length:1356 start_codon:yes stop_codon:yes gene_type:complete